MEFWNRASRIRGIRFNGIRAHVPLDGEAFSKAEYEEEIHSSTTKYLPFFWFRDVTGYRLTC